MKNYVLKDKAKGASDDIEQRTIEVSEDVTETKVNRVTVAQLKQEREQKINQIQSLVKEVDRITDDLLAMNTELSLSIPDIPEKLENVDGNTFKGKLTNSTPEWKANIQVVKGEQYTFEGATYEVIQSHTTQAGWTPPNVPALFSLIQ